MQKTTAPFCQIAELFCLSKDLDSCSASVCAFLCHHNLVRLLVDSNAKRFGKLSKSRTELSVGVQVKSTAVEDVDLVGCDVSNEDGIATAYSYAFCLREDASTKVEEESPCTAECSAILAHSYYDIQL